MKGAYPFANFRILLEPQLLIAQSLYFRYTSPLFI